VTGAKILPFGLLPFGGGSKQPLSISRTVVPPRGRTRACLESCLTCLSLRLGMCHTCGVSKAAHSRLVFGLLSRLKLGKSEKVWHLFGLIPHLKLGTPKNIWQLFGLPPHFTSFIPYKLIKHFGLCHKIKKVTNQYNIRTNPATMHCMLTIICNSNISPQTAAK
jgi:hypothetical protein